MQKQSNRLIKEKSPYLLQHAENPVDWYPWGEDAFRKAREQDLPIFLSSGYSTCHWCHVMERESFENPKTASFINTHFVPVKLDREEHPDIDHLYMLFVQATTGRGGWPLSVWLTHDLKPFFGGSYFPPVERWGMPSFRSLLEVLARMWTHDRQRLLLSANSIMDQLIDLARPKAVESGEITDSHAERCYRELERSFDPEWGGFGGAPKFPRPALLSFLFSHAACTGNGKAAEMALLTLKKMAYGGIHDQLGITGRGGGGFARYSTDRFWHVPHFEKMLYDNAQLAGVYLEAYQASGEQLFADTANDILQYVLGDMTSPEGAFCSAEDADSPTTEGSGINREGAFYLWTEKEITALLDAEEALLFIEAFGISPEGNAADDPHGEFTGRNILIRTLPDEALADSFGLPTTTIKERLNSARTKLFDARLKRPRPALDDKILTAWNGLMISSLAKGSCIIGEKRVLDAAKCAARFIISTLYEPASGRIKRRYRDGESALDGNASDYAGMIQGVLDLYQASFEPEWLRIALRLSETQIERFFDQKDGVFYSTAFDDKSIPLRLIEDNDGAEPSANSTSAINLLRLAAITGRNDLRTVALRTIRYFSHTLDEHPTALPLMLVARNLSISLPALIIFAGKRDDPSMTRLVETAYRSNKAELTMVYADETLKELLPEALAIARTHHGIPAAYLCAEGNCKPAVNDPDTLANMLAGLK